MSTWSNLANNRYISTNNIFNGVIAGSISLFTGNTLTFSNSSSQWIDKLTFSNSIPHGTLSNTFNNKLDNQWITKADIVPGMECPCDYSITYSTVINNYDCYNLTNAMSPLSFAKTQRVRSGSWNNSFPVLFLNYNTAGIGDYQTFGTKDDNSTNYVWMNAFNTSYGRMNETALWVKDNFFTITSTSSLSNGYYTNATPVAYTVGSSVWCPINVWFGLAYPFTPAYSRTYYFGINGDNLIKVYMNGQILLDNSPNWDGSNYTYFSGSFQQWCIYPINLKANVKYDFNFYVYNAATTIPNGNPAGFAAELYDFTGLTNSTYPGLTSALSNLITSTSSLDTYILFSTKDMGGANWGIGNDISYSCPIYPDATLLSPDANGIYKCLVTKPQTNYPLGCQEYVTLVATPTVPSTTTIRVNTTLAWNIELYSIDFGDETPILNSVDIPLVYTSANIPPYTGTTAYTSPLGSFPAGLSPSGFTRYTTPLIYTYSGGTSSLVIGNVSGNYDQNTFQIFSHTYTQSGVYNIKVYANNIPLNLGGGYIFNLICNNGNIQYITNTNNFYKKYNNKLGFNINLNNNKLTNFDQNFDQNFISMMNKGTFSSSSLSLNNNGISSFNLPISFIQTLGTLDLSYNNLTTFTPVGSFTVSSLLLNNNKITIFNPNYSNYIFKLYLDYNNISLFNPIYLLKTTFSGSILSISYNPSPTFSFQNNFLNYETINLNNCTMSYFNPYYINGTSQSCMNPKTLNLQNNSLTGSFSPDYLICTFSSTILLDTNKIVTYDPKKLLNGLSILSITNNKIVNFDPSYQPLPNTLLSLNLQSNLITSFDPINYALPNSLKNLNLNGNTMSNFNPINYPLPSGLQTLLLEGNNIQSFSGSLPSGLGYLDLSFNPLTYINGNCFNNVNGLLVLCINYNKVNFSLTPTTAPNFGNIPFTATGSLAYPPIYNLYNGNISQQDGIGYWTANTVYDSILLINNSFNPYGLTAIDGITFSNNLSTISIQTNWPINTFSQFTPLSLPTGLKIFVLSGNSYLSIFSKFNFDLFLNTSIKNINFTSTSITSASASSLLPSTLTSITFTTKLIGGLSSPIPLNYFDADTMIPPYVNYLNLAACRLPSAVLENILGKLAYSYSVFTGSVYVNNQFGVTTSVTPDMSASLYTLISRGWTYSI